MHALLTAPTLCGNIVHAHGSRRGATIDTTVGGLLQYRITLRRITRVSKRLLTTRFNGITYVTAGHPLPPHPSPGAHTPILPERP